MFSLQDVGFEPTRMTPLRPQRSPVTTWVILPSTSFLVFNDGSNTTVLLEPEFQAQSLSQFTPSRA
jgi:hypothetical protein